MNRRKKSIPRKFLEFALLVVFLPFIPPLIILLLLGWVLYALNIAFVYLLVWAWWVPKGKDVLYVYSDSTIWKEYMEIEILPLVMERAIVLNWSGRKSWPKLSFAVHVVRTFGRGRNFNPMVVVFRPFRLARFFRFFAAFKDWKHGDTTSVEQIRRDLMQAL
jgi:hypothetical protein